MKRLNFQRALVSLASAICAIAGVATMEARADIVFTGDHFIGLDPVPGGVFVSGSGDLSALGVTLGSNGIGSLLIDGNNTLTTTDGNLAQGSFDTFGTATLTGLGAVWNINSSLGPGSDGMGVLNIWNEAIVNVAGFVVIAGAVTSTGIVTVQGSGSLLDIASFLDAGGEGRGFLNIVDGGVVNAGTGFDVSHDIAGGAGSSGTVIVQGTDSELNLTGRLTVGNSENATGTVNVSDGGALKTTGLRLGNGVGASGTVNITNGGTLTRTGNGFGTFVTRIGNQGSGVVTVSGLGSMLTFQGLRDNGNPDRVRIGDSGHGVLHVSGGGQVLVDGTEAVNVDPLTNAPTTGIRLGRIANSIGVLTVSGLGSLVTVDGGANARVRLNVGQVTETADPSETGTMVIKDGGKVTIVGDNPNSAVVIANRPGAVGTLRVTGIATDELGAPIPGGESTLNSGKMLCVGSRPNPLPGPFSCAQDGGIGILIIDDGGVINVETLGVGTQGQILGSGGTINVSGATLTNGGTIRPGGTMTINGRFVQTPGGTIILTVNGTGEGEFDQLVLTGEVKLEGTIEVVLAEGVELTGETSLEVLVVDQDLVDDTVSAEVNVMDESGGLIASFESTGGSGLNIQFTGVAIDIKPGSETNSINLGSNGVVPVAILSSDTFDATTVDPTSVKLASAAVKMRGNGTFLSSIEDVNGDGRLDLVIQVETTALGLTLTATEATLTGSTFDNVVIQGMDLIVVVPDKT